VVTGRNPLVGLIGSGIDAEDTEAMVVRNVVGIDESRGGFALPEPVRSGTRLVALVPESDPMAIGSHIRGGPDRQCGVGPAPGCAIHLACRTAADVLLAAYLQRGELRDTLGGAPLLGVSTAYQIAPSARSPGRPELHTYSGVLSLLR
jgi:small ligand-binding sensory domain FIST